MLQEHFEGQPIFLLAHVGMHAWLKAVLQSLVAEHQVKPECHQLEPECHQFNLSHGLNHKLRRNLVRPRESRALISSESSNQNVPLIDMPANTGAHYGVKDISGRWRTSKHDAALAWQSQCADIENAETVTIEQLRDAPTPGSRNLNMSDLLGIPTLYAFEQAIRDLNVGKAAGFDGLGAEIYRADPALTAFRCYPLLVKMILRGQWHCGCINCSNVASETSPKM